MLVRRKIRTFTLNILRYAKPMMKECLNDFERQEDLNRKLFGHHVSAFPLNFVAPIVFGQLGKNIACPVIRNGTALLIKFNDQPMAITCAHVVEAYCAMLSGYSDIRFKLGNLEFNPLSNIIGISNSTDLDLVTINLKNEATDLIFEASEIKNGFYEPPKWPPNEVELEDLVSLGGFPGLLRIDDVYSGINARSFSIGGCRVTAKSEKYFVLQIDREQLKQTIGVSDADEIRKFGGISGCPVFILRKHHFELAGIVYQAPDEFDLIRVRPASFLNENGTIVKDEQWLP